MAEHFYKKVQISQGKEGGVAPAHLPIEEVLVEGKGLEVAVNGDAGGEAENAGESHQFLGNLASCADDENETDQAGGEICTGEDTKVVGDAAEDFVVVFSNLGFPAMEFFGERIVGEF